MSTAIYFRFARSISVLLILLLITGCGGGGGGGGGSSNDGGNDNYTGSTSQAVITSSSAQDLIVGAYTGGTMGAQLGGGGGASAQIAPTQISSYPTTMILSRAVQEVISKGKLSSRAMPLTEASTQMDPVTIEGPCGGEATENDNIDEDNGDITGNIVFDNFCILGVTINGTVTYTGNVDFDSGDFSLNTNYNNISVTTPCISGTESGNVLISITNDGSVCTYRYTNFYIHDNNQNKTYWLHDYTVTLSNNGYSIEGSMSGRYYHPDYGYIDVSTAEPVVIVLGDTTPSSGVLIGVGQNGVTTRLTLESYESYIVEIDNDQDGFFDDWSSGAVYWTDGCAGTTGTITGTVTYTGSYGPVSASNPIIVFMNPFPDSFGGFVENGTTYQMVSITSSPGTFNFYNVPPGQYHLGVVFDLDDDGVSDGDSCEIYTPGSATGSNYHADPDTVFTVTAGAMYTTSPNISFNDSMWVGE